MLRSNAYQLKFGHHPRYAFATGAIGVTVLADRRHEQTIRNLRAARFQRSHSKSKAAMALLNLP
jgi:hypothetical protein